MSEVPDWLQQQDGEMPSTTGLQDTTMTPTPATTAALSTSKEFPPSDDTETRSSNKKWSSWICGAFLYVVSLVLVAVLVYSLLQQFNDESDVWLWALYYGSHATLAAVFILVRMFGWTGSVETVLGLCSLLMLAFTGVMVYFSIGDYQDASSNDEGGDIDGKNAKEEALFEVAGVVLGGLSLVYHVCVWRCTRHLSRRAKKENDEDNGDDFQV